MTDLSQIGNMLAGFGAGVQGQLPQFLQQQQNQEQLKMQQEQFGLQKQEMQQKLAQERMKTYFLDADAGLKLVNADKPEAFLNLGLQRLQLLKNFPDADPSDTQLLVQLGTAWKNGSAQAKQHLKAELENAVTAGKAFGIIKTEKPQNIPQSEISKAGQMVQIDPATGKPTVVDLTATGYKPEVAKEAERKTAQDVNGVLRYVDTGQEVFPSVEKAPESPKVYQESSDMRKEFSGIQVVKDFAQQSTAYGRIQASAKEPSAAGDLALIFNFMKVLDPGSTVREGEFANAQNAGGVSDRIVGLYNRIIDGERLTETQRADFLNRSEKLYKNAESDFMTTYNQFAKIAKRRNLPVEDALIDYRHISEPETEKSIPSPSSSAVQEGMTATNPATGEQIVYRNGQWRKR